MDLIGPISSGQVIDCIVTDSDQDTNLVISGRVVAVYVDVITPLCIDTPTIKITTKSPVQTILEISTDGAGWYYPVTIQHLNTTGAPIANAHSLGVPIHDYVNVQISDANFGDEVRVWLLVE